MFWDGSRFFDIESINIKNEQGKFRIYWDHDSPIDVYLAQDDDHNNKLLVVNNFVGEYLDCFIDASYVEIFCKSQASSYETDFIDITSLYSELPASIDLMVFIDGENTPTTVNLTLD